MATDSVDLESPRSRTFLWCVARSASNALIKCLSAIEGNEVWFEPFCYCNVAAVEVEHQLNEKLPQEYHGNEEIYQKAIDVLVDLTASHFNPELISYASVKQKLERTTSPHVLVKDIACGYKDEIRYIPNGYKHTFLIRHPLRTIRSYRQSIFNHLLQHGYLRGAAAYKLTFDVERDNPYVPEGFNYTHLYNIWKYVRDNLDCDPIVIDTDDLLADPARMVSAYCQAVGLPYDESLLKWDASSDIAKCWKAPADDLIGNMSELYETAMRSSEFLPADQMPRRDQVTPDVIRCSDQVLKYYEEMYETRMK